MQSYSLTVDKFLDHAAKWLGTQEVVSVHHGTEVTRINYAQLRQRSNQFSGALRAIGLNFGDRIGTLAWNTQHHMEMYYATMGIGLICHTLNPRFSASHLATIINEAENRALAVSANLLPLLQELLLLCPCIEHVILMDEDDVELAAINTQSVSVWRYEELLSNKGQPVEWGEFDENTPAGLCYTSGTTGKPKGVLYTHRSNYLHTLCTLQTGGIALRSNDVLLVAVPMFHANGWGLPFSAPAIGSKMVLPGRNADGASLATLMRNERVTVAAAVQTVWLGLVEHLDECGGELPDLERILIGGSKCPDALIKRIEDRLGARVQTSWGMTELSPLGTVTALFESNTDSRTAGRPLMGIDLKLTDAQGNTLEDQRGVVGHLKAKGASVVDRYYQAEHDSLDEQGYFDTGDLAMIDERGHLSICGRSKDLIKSGGEWINPAEIEDIIGQIDSVGQVAVIGKPDEKWGERPILIVEANAGEVIDSSTLLNQLRGKIPDWWIPKDVIMIDTMPLAATGKIDKLWLKGNYKSLNLSSI
ncbi:AMP-binding protein [Neptunicella sp.]|uniref:AMP-binding protein n=1 Tax=Neptunicella sp. TaxID=2125986 RepID=UPI003F693F78